MDELDRRIVNSLQGGFPVSDRPYAEAARALGTDEATLIGRIGALLEAGTLSRFGPLFDVERLGGAFSLCALEAPADAFDRIAALVNAHPEVAHNYAREHRLNMWFVLAARARADIGQVIAEIEGETGCTVYNFPREAEFFIDLRLRA